MLGGEQTDLVPGIRSIAFYVSCTETPTWRVETDRLTDPVGHGVLGDLGFGSVTRVLLFPVGV